MNDFNKQMSKRGESFSSGSESGFCINLFDPVLTKLAEKPTYEVNILDLVLATNDDLDDNVVAGEMYGANDHRHVSFEVAFGTLFNDGQPHIVIKIPDFRFANSINLCIRIRWNYCTWEMKRIWTLLGKGFVRYS